MTPQELLVRVAPPHDEEFLVALSGGPDSAVAAWVASRLAVGRVRAIHVHHGTAAADLLAKSALAVAELLGCHIDVARVEVPAGASWEGHARKVRWAAIDDHLHEGEAVVTGHHADDLAETTLGHLLRGAGATGLASIALPRSRIWRPLIGFTRKDILCVAEALELPAAEDPSNYDLSYKRNVLRHEVIPQLEATVSPRLRSNLTRTARALAADDALIEATIDPVVPHRDAWGAWRLPAALVTTASEAAAARLVRRLLRAARPPYAGNRDEVDVALDVAHARSGRREIADGWQLELEGPWLVAHTGEVPAPGLVECAVPGVVAFGGMTVRVATADAVVIRRTSLLATSAVGPRLLLRGAAVGERIEIAAGTKLIRDVMAEAGVPRRLRSAWPVAVTHERIVAVAGIRSAPWARGTAGQEGVVELTVEEGQS